MDDPCVNCGNPAEYELADGTPVCSQECEDELNEDIDDDFFGSDDWD